MKNNSQVTSIFLLPNLAWETQTLSKIGILAKRLDELDLLDDLVYRPRACGDLVSDGFCLRVQVRDPCQELAGHLRGQLLREA